MNCMKLCQNRISLRRALYLAAAQIVLALIVAGSTEPARAGDAVTSNWHGQVQAPSGPVTVIPYWTPTRN